MVTTGFITAFGCNRLLNVWICVLRKKASRRASARLRDLFTSGRGHKSLARSPETCFTPCCSRALACRYTTSYETSCSNFEFLVFMNANHANRSLFQRPALNSSKELGLFNHEERKNMKKTVIPIKLCRVACPWLVTA